MGAPALPSVPRAWLGHCDIKLLPAEEGMEAEAAIWIKELSAWIAEDARHLEELRAVLGPEARILLPSDLPPAP